MNYWHHNEPTKQAKRTIGFGFFFTFLLLHLFYFLPILSLLLSFFSSFFFYFCIHSKVFFFSFSSCLILLKRFSSPVFEFFLLSRQIIFRSCDFPTWFCNILKWTKGRNRSSVLEADVAFLKRSASLFTPFYVNSSTDNNSLTLSIYWSNFCFSNE